MGFVQRDSVRITIISYAGAAIGYLNKIFLFTNFLTTEQVGLANLLITISVLYAQVASLGSYNIVLRFFPFFQNREKKHHGFLFGMMALSMGGFIIATLLFLLFQKPFKLIYQESSPLLIDYALYMIPLALASVYYQLFESYLRSLQKNIIPSVVQELILRIAITLSVLLFALGIISFPGFVFIYVMVNCLPAVIIVAYTAFVRHLFVVPVFSPMVRRMGRLILVYGLFSLFNNLSFLILSSVDSLMVAGMIDLGSAGIYTTMIFVTSVMLIPYRSIVRVSGPLVAGFWKHRAMDKMRDIYRKATATNLVAGSLIFLLIWVNLDSLFLFMPGDYEAGRTVFLLLGLGKLFDMASGLNGVILLTSKKYRYDLMFTAGLIALAVASNLIFIPLLGMNGAALASMLTIFLFNILRIAFINHHYHMQPFMRKDLLVPALLMVLMLLSSVSGQILHVLIDIPVRSLMAAALFIIPVYLLNISPDINQMIDQVKKMVLH